MEGAESDDGPGGGERGWGGGDSKCAAVARSLHALLAEVDKRGQSIKG